MKNWQKTILLALIVASIFSLGSGCEVAPVLMLWNRTNSELRVEREKQKPISIDINSRHKLPVGGIWTLGDKYDFVLGKDHKRIGYKIDFLALKQLQKFHFHRIDFELNDNNEVYVLRIDNLKFDPSTNQPVGFPMTPAFVKDL